MEGRKKRIQGIVISNKSDKTIVVQNETYVKHKIYKKAVKKRHKYYAHDELNECKIGDEVIIEECRPLSKLKRFKLVSIEKKAIESIKVKDEKAVEEVLETKEKEETKEAE